MAFIATPAFSNLYGGGLVSLSSVPQTAQTTMILQNDGSVMSSIGVAPNGSIQHTPVQKSAKKILDPFDPAAILPLPFQLNDQYGAFATSVWKRNERERYRVRCVNEGYNRLRLHLPLSEEDKRISKVDTLRLAIRYINHLNAVLRNENHMMGCRCFERFTEESEGNVRVELSSMGQRKG